MLVNVTRTASTLTLRALFYVGLFAFVVAAHLGLSSILSEQGWSEAAAMTGSGAAVLALVLILVNLADWIGDGVADWRYGVETDEGATEVVTASHVGLVLSGAAYRAVARHLAAASCVRAGG